MPAALKVLQGMLKSKVLMLPDEGQFLLGRSMEAHLTLYGPQIEDRHAVIVLEDGVHRLVPVARRRATRLRGKVLKQAHVLSDGDVFSIGRHEFAYQADVSEAGDGEVCGLCGEEVSSSGLQVGDGVACSRCVDRRLGVDRDLDSYRILRKIATNEEEVTYLAVDGETNGRVAIRILKASRQERPRVFRRFVARALAGLVLDHPNYLDVKSIRSQGGITYVVLEHQEHTKKLERMVREASPIAVLDALQITNQLAEVLRYARTRKIVVAKRKKSGVLIDRGNWVKVLAYDLTRELEDSVVQTDAFAELVRGAGRDPEELRAPELGEPTDDLEARLSRLAQEHAEVYSIGRILWQFLTGRSFDPGVIKEIKAVRKGESVSAPKSRRPTRSLAQLPEDTLELLDRTLTPSGPERLRSLIAFATRSKQTILDEVARREAEVEADPEANLDTV